MYVDSVTSKQAFGYDEDVKSGILPERLVPEFDSLCCPIIEF